MNMNVRLLATTALLSLAPALPALALTPQEVLDNLTSSLEAPGVAVQFMEPEKSGDNLTVKDFAVTYDDGDERLSVHFPTMVLEDDGEGGVILTAPDDIVVEVEAGEAIFKVEFGTADAAIAVAEEGEEFSLGLAADQMTMRIFDLVVDDDVMAGDIKVDMKGLELGLSLEADVAYQVAVDFESATVAGDVKHPEAAAAAILHVDLGANAYEFGIHGGEDWSLDLAESLRKGLVIHAFNHLSSGNYTLTMFGADSEQESVTTSVSWGSSTSNLSLDEAGLIISVETEDLASQTSSAAGLPMVIDFAVPKAKFDLTVPVLAGEDTQQMKMLVSLPDMIFDVQSDVLPAEIKALLDEPMSFVFDTSVDLVLDRDLIADDSAEDLAKMAAGDMSHLGKVGEISLTDLLVAGGGASIAMSALIDGVENAADIPVGEATVTMKNIPALVDRLAELGLMTDEIGMGMLMLQGVAEMDNGDPSEMRFVIKSDKSGLEVNGQKF